MLCFFHYSYPRIGWEFAPVGNSGSFCYHLRVTPKERRVLQQVEAWFIAMRRLDSLAAHERLLFVAAADWLHARQEPSRAQEAAVEDVEFLPDEALESLPPSLVASLRFEVDSSVSEPPSDVFAGGLPRGAYLRQPRVPTLPEPLSERETLPRQELPTVPSPAYVRRMIRSTIPASEG